MRRHRTLTTRFFLCASTRWLSFCLMAATLVSPGCSSKADEEESGVAPLSENASFVFQSKASNGTTTQIAVKPEGTKQVLGKTYPRIRAGDFTAADPEGVEIWGKFDGDTLEVAGAEIYRPGLGGTTTPDFTTQATNEPLRINLNPPVGQAQTVTIKGDHVVTATGGKIPLDVTATYTLVEDNATVETPLGTFTGVKHFKANTTVAGQEISGEAWYDPGLGVVKATIKPDNVELGLESLLDAGVPKEGTNIIRADGLLAPSKTTLKLNTYDLNKAFDADKNTHANMVLEMRWADPTKAKSSEKPPIKELFTAALGYFPSQFVMSPVSIFFPKESNQGFNYWVAIVDQAAKNDPSTGGINYAIEAKYQPATTNDKDPVRVSMRIRYHLVTP
jgi:hypothetical protein